MTPSVSGLLPVVTGLAAALLAVVAAGCAMRIITPTPAPEVATIAGTPASATRPVPAIDLVAPADVDTATFSMG